VRVVVEQEHRSRPGGERRTDARIVAARVAFVLRKPDDPHIRKLAPDRLDGVVAGPVVDDDHGRPAEVGRRKAPETGERVVAPVPVEDHDPHVAAAERRRRPRSTPRAQDVPNRGEELSRRAHEEGRPRSLCDGTGRQGKLARRRRSDGAVSPTTRSMR
jgi:hypothetical protein